MGMMRKDVDVKKFCKMRYDTKKEEFICEIEKWFDHVFISHCIPWRCIDGYKFCPIYADFDLDLPSITGRIHWGWKFEWPKNLGMSEVIEILKDFGFICRKNSKGYPCVSVPTPKKGAKLTPAQKYVKKINTNYQEFLSKTKNLALINKSAFLNKLIEAQHFEIYKDYTIFYNFHYTSNKDYPWYKIMLKLLKRENIEEYYDSAGNYIGVIVYH